VDGLEEELADVVDVPPWTSRSSTATADAPVGAEVGDVWTA
jgi:hypothetical protein